MLAFKVPDESTRRMLQLVASYGGLQKELDIVVGGVDDVEFQDASGAKRTGSNTAARFITSMCPAAERLLGSTPEQQAQVSEWLTFRRTELTPLMDDKLEKLNDWLLSRTLLAGNEVTLADLAVYAAVQPAACAFPVAQHQHFCNLLRWYDFVHRSADKSAIFPAAKFARPPLRLPPPLPPAPPKAKGSDAAAPSTTADAAAPAAKADGKAAKKAAGSAGKGDSGGAAVPPPTPAASTEAAPATPSATDSTASGAAAPGAGTDSGLTPDILDLRVGVVVKVGPHPNADSLYVEEIDVGEEAPRQVVSGLRKFVSEEAMQGRRVVVVCNLKPAKMRDVMSYGMVLCASNHDHTVVDPVAPPEGVPAGERVRFEGFGGDPEAQLNPRKKLFEKLAPDLVTDAAGVCTFKGTVPFSTSKGPVTASLPNAHIA